MSEQNVDPAVKEAEKKRDQLWITIYSVSCLCSPFATLNINLLAIPFIFILLPVGLVYDYSLIWTNLLNYFGATIQVIWQVDGWLFLGALFISYWIFWRHRKLFIKATDRRVYLRLIWALIFLVVGSLIGCGKMARDPNWDPMPEQM